MSDERQENEVTIETLRRQLAEAKAALAKANKRQATLSAMSQVIQGWGEICSRQLAKELSPEMQWYVTGLQTAHLLDAARIRTGLHPGVAPPPPGGSTPFVKAYEAMLEMMMQVASSAVNGVELPPSAVPLPEAVVVADDAE